MNDINIEIDAVIETPQRIPAHLALKTAPSLKPGLAMMEAAAFGQPEACAIREAWKFKHPVKIMSRDEFALAVERGTVNFSA